MKRVLPVLIVALFLAGFLVVPAGVTTTPARMQETSQSDDVTHEQEYDMSWLPPTKTIRIALYNETNSTIPDYATNIRPMNTNYTFIYDIFVNAGYQVTRLTIQDILDHELVIGNYDVIVLADNCPRENITHLVREFWLGGGGVLSFNSAASFLGFAGILPRETLDLDDGYVSYWDYLSNDNGNVSARHPVTQDHQLDEKLAYFNDDWVQYDWSALLGTTIAESLVNLTIDDEDAGWVQTVASDPTDMGGKVVQIGIPIDPWASAWENMMIDAVEWLCPRPKGRIAYDLTHNPIFGVDTYDDDFAQSTAVGHEKMRTAMVSRQYTFDKLYPNAGLTPATLAEYDILIINNPNVAFTSQEITDVENWVSSGGSLLLIADHSLGPNNILNSLLSNTNFELNVTEAANSLSPTGTHITHEGASSMTCAASGTVNFSSPAVPIWDDGAGNVVLALQVHDSGRIAIIADNFPFRDSGFNIADNGQVAINLVNWLSSAATTVLAFVDENIIVNDPNDNPYRGPVAQALNELGVSWYYSGDDDYFNESLYLYDWDLVVIDQFATNMNFFWGDLLDYVESGERLIIQSMQLNQLVDNAQKFRDYVGVNYVNNFINPTPPIYFWEGSDSILTNPRNYAADNITVNANWAFSTCQNLTYYSNATAIGGLSHSKPGSNSNSSIILGVGGNVLVNGMVLTVFNNDTDDSTYKDNFEIWQNEITFMLRPTIDSPSDMTIEVGSRGESITWTPNSFKPQSYSLVRNSFELYNGHWDGSPIILDLEEDNLGSETFYLTVYDIFGQSITDALVVTKEDTTAPAFVYAPDSVHYVEGTITFTLSWTFTDMFPDSFVFYIDGEYETSDVWDGYDITFNVGGFSPGVYNLTIAVNDTSGNLATSMVYLNVTEAATTSTTSTTSETITTTETTTPEPSDTDYTLIIIIIAVGVVLILIIVYMRRRS